jgi:poly-gamma-glutamate capsule biosynthesis protein CapA/YwtB (metallophosphatase superfamily)
MTNMDLNQNNPLTVFLCGDVMTGRGIDQILPYPSSPTLHESYVINARDYVKLAEDVNGPIHRPVSFEYIWGDALAELEPTKVDVRIINLETSITSSHDWWPEKDINYRMNPPNIGCLTAAHIDACSLANNHVLDWGYTGLTETLETLDQAGIAHAGAGQNVTEAAAPAILEVPDKGRVLLFSFGSVTSGIPPEWAATDQRAGVNLLKDISKTTARNVANQMKQFQKPGDVMIASIHWGGNWGYEIFREQVVFAHLLVEEGVTIVHGHSSHHVKSFEVYQDRLILYGCGNFLSDYEGITGYEMYRGELTLMYLAQVDPQDGRLVSTQLVPMQVRRLQLNHASAADARLLHLLLTRLGEPFATQVELADDKSMNLVWSTKHTLASVESAGQQ